MLEVINTNAGVPHETITATKDYSLSIVRLIFHLLTLQSPESDAIIDGRWWREEHGISFKEEGNSRMVRCFSLGSILVLVALAASMVVLPLMLPPLPPPPLLLLFFPVGIMAALMFLAFSPYEGAANVVV
ncbi:putative Transmembrane protein [Quillaja saponaria]|uniref:Transmembrane protein n=1 Tax=Quillaja saponaria TaxID=32244 RepID=A0AAD7QJD9_QUISA|nr:putative Transmembrane protein [Quillaja saponaria]